MPVAVRASRAVELLTFERGQNWTGGWSPDGDQIAFAGERNGVWNVSSVSRRSKRVMQLTHFTSILGFVRYPIWSPRNDRIVFERNERRGNLWTTRIGGQDGLSGRARAAY
jgi:TolB protein